MRYTGACGIVPQTCFVRRDVLQKDNCYISGNIDNYVNVSVL